MHMSGHKGLAAHMATVGSVRGFACVHEHVFLHENHGLELIGACVCMHWAGARGAFSSTDDAQTKQ